MKKIIVAGAGHGGIATAAMLSEKGYEVTVFEKNERHNLGYDWTDIFDKNSLTAAEITMPPKDKYTPKGDVSFYSPSERAKFIQPSPENQSEIKMERKDIYDLLISKAEKCGVEFEYGYEVKAPVVEDGRVMGIETDKGSFFGDLVIDACGCDSPVRKNLPDFFGIQKEAKTFEKFYVYRVFFDNPENKKSDEEFKLTLFSQGIPGISWVMSEKSFTDVLVGRFESFSYSEAQESIEYLRKLNSNIGTQILRGGSFAVIPVRQPLGKMVCDGYAAIGDSAFMTIPLIGSGIANALFASKILSEAVLNDASQEFNAEALWQYQYKYFKKIALKYAPLACFKNILVKTSPDTLDKIFDTGAEDIFINFSSVSKNDFPFLKFAVYVSLLAKNALSDKEFSKELIPSVKSVVKLLNMIQKIPLNYSENDVLLWAQKYNRIFD